MTLVNYVRQVRRRLPLFPRAVAMRSYAFLSLLALLWAALPCLAAEQFETLKPARTLFRYSGDVVGFDAIAEPPRMLLVYQVSEKPPEYRIVTYAPGENSEYVEQASIPVKGDVRRTRFLIGGDAILFILDDGIPMPRFEHSDTKERSIRFGNAFIADLRERKVELFSRECFDLRLSPARDRVSVLTVFRGLEKISHDFTLDLCWWRKDAKTGERTRWLRLSVPLNGASPFYPGTWSSDGRAYAFSAGADDLMGRLEAYRSAAGQRVRAEAEKLGEKKDAEQVAKVMAALQDISKSKSGEHMLLIATPPDIDVAEWDAQTMETVARRTLDDAHVAQVAAWESTFVSFPGATALAYRRDRNQVLAYVGAPIDGEWRRGFCQINTVTPSLEWLLEPGAPKDEQQIAMSIYNQQFRASPDGETVFFLGKSHDGEAPQFFSLVFDVASGKLSSLDGIDTKSPHFYRLVGCSAWVGDELWIAQQDRVDAYPIKPSGQK